MPVVHRGYARGDPNRVGPSPMGNQQPLRSSIYLPAGTGPPLSAIFFHCADASSRSPV